MRDAVSRQFGRSFARHAVDGLSARFPDMSARVTPARWQRLVVMLGAMAILLALVMAPVKTIWVVTLALATLFVPVIGFRLIAAYGPRSYGRRR